MKLLHTSDWHLGRQLHGVSLLEDQRVVLDQIVETLVEREVDVLLVSGDVYDRSLPPVEAVDLLDDVVSRVSGELGIPIVMIGGNHDSGGRLQFGSRLLAGSGLHIAGSLSGDIEPVVLSDKHGDVAFYSIPYADPITVRTVFDVEVKTHDEAMGFLCERIAADNADNRRCVVLGHCFLAGGEVSDSERPLTIGGIANVSPEHFARFTYAALGHLHAPQAKLADHIRYSGSILKYSFSEVTQNKSVTLVELDGSGCGVTQVALKPRRDVRVVEGSLDEILAAVPDDDCREDYVLVRLRDTHAILDALGKLRTVYPNVLQLERPALLGGGRPAPGPGIDHKAELPMVQAFFEQMTEKKLGEAGEEVVKNLLDRIHRGEEV